MSMIDSGFKLIAIRSVESVGCNGNLSSFRENIACIENMLQLLKSNGEHYYAMRDKKDGEK